MKTENIINDKYSFLERCVKLKDSHIKWIRLLTQDKDEEIEKYERFLDLSRDNGMSAICKYRTQLQNEGIRGKVSVVETKKAFEKNNLDELKELLQELFLEYMDVATIKIIVKKLHKTDLTVEKMFQLHSENPKARLLSLI